MRFRFFVLLIMSINFLGLTSCKNDAKIPEEINTNDNSKTSLDWYGQYKGILPCADCSGIATTLTLKADGIYQRVVFYKDKSEKAEIDRGRFSWDESGSVITLSLKDGASQSYKVGENQLWHLDNNQQLITGDLAERYILKKNRMDANLENKSWVLVELMGQPVELAENQKEAFLIFESENAMISGNNGCNRISMGYELLEGKRLKIAPGISTLMACPDETISDRFNEVLQRADNYTVNNGELHLNKARMAPLAKFKLKNESE